MVLRMRPGQGTAMWSHMGWPNPSNQIGYVLERFTPKVVLRMRGA